MFTVLYPGDRCGDYEIVRALARGSSADVYLGRAPTGELRALKLMNAPEAGKERARFAQEGEVLAQIVHPNVVRVYDAGASGDTAWLLLELVDGETLAQKIQAGGRPSLEDLLDWMMQVCDGLAAAHDIHVVHRDLAPDNILVSRDGRVKLCDFGMAKMRKWGVRTTNDQQLGTAKYMAPEQAQGAPASPAMDIYSLGHVLYHAIAGVHAMGDAPRTLIDICRWQIWQPPRPLQELAPWVPSDLAALVHEALEKDPAKRPPSARAVFVRLQRVCAALRAPQLRAVRNMPGLAVTPPFAPTIPPAPPAPTLVPAADEPRATDEPVEGAARRSSVIPRRVSAAAFAPPRWARRTPRGSASSGASSSATSTS
jgi:serine/threonine-protein kinase